MKVLPFFSLLALFVSSVLATSAAAKSLILPPEMWYDLISWCVDRPWTLSPMALTCRDAFQARVWLAVLLLKELSLPISDELSVENFQSIIRQAQVLSALYLPWPEDWTHPHEQAELRRLVSPDVLEAGELAKLTSPVEYGRLVALSWLLRPASFRLGREFIDYLMAASDTYLLNPGANDFFDDVTDDYRHGKTHKAVLANINWIYRTIGGKSQDWQSALEYFRSVVAMEPDLASRQLLESNTLPSSNIVERLDENGLALVLGDFLQNSTNFLQALVAAAVIALITGFHHHFWPNTDFQMVVKGKILNLAIMDCFILFGFAVHFPVDPKGFQLGVWVIIWNLILLIFCGSLGFM